MSCHCHVMSIQQAALPGKRVENSRCAAQNVFVFRKIILQASMHARAYVRHSFTRLRPRTNPGISYLANQDAIKRSSGTVSSVPASQLSRRWHHNKPGCSARKSGNWTCKQARASIITSSFEHWSCQIFSFDCFVEVW